MYNRQSGGIITEFAIVVPILLFLILSLIEFSHILFARSIINVSAESALELATVIHGLDIPGVDGTKNDEAEEKVIQKAIDRAKIYFKDGRSLDDQSGRVITEVVLDIGEIDTTSNPQRIRPDLTTYLTRNPVRVIVRANLPLFSKRLGINWRMSASAVGFREPSLASNTAAIVDCHGNPISAANFEQPDECPCFANLNDPNLIQIGNSCFCKPPYVPVPANNPTQCVCPAGSHNSNLQDCKCRTCQEQGWTGIAPDIIGQNDICGCFCKQPFVAVRSGDTINCQCPDDMVWDDSLQKCMCNMAVFTAPGGPCPPPKFAYSDSQGRCKCDYCSPCVDGDGNICPDPTAPGCRESETGEPCRTYFCASQNQTLSICECEPGCLAECPVRNPNWIAASDSSCRCTCKHPTLPNTPAIRTPLPADHASNPCPRPDQVWTGWNSCSCVCDDINSVESFCPKCTNPSNRSECSPSGQCLFPSDPTKCTQEPCCRPVQCLISAGCYFNSITNRWEFPEQ